MPRYEYECPECHHKLEMQLPLEFCDDRPICFNCGKFMNKIFTKLTTSWKDKDRKWGTSLYRSHDKGEKIGKEKKEKD
jgi:putative FmdB family regulatory protein